MPDFIQDEQGVNLKLSVCVITYNHSKYIVECLSSILMQEFEGDYEVIISDDASTDGTAAVVGGFISDNNLNNYHLYESSQNKGMMRNFIGALSSCSGDYIALCEGDDYWTDKSKIQKQLNVMSNFPGCALVIHPCTLHKSEKDKDSVAFLKSEEQFNFFAADILSTSGQFSPSASYMLKREVVEELPAWLSGAPIGDFFIELYSMKQGYGVYLPVPMSAYRVFSNNSWSDVMRKDNGTKMLCFGEKMLDCFHELEKDSFFMKEDFSNKKSAVLTNISIANLFLKRRAEFRLAIESSVSSYKYSSSTQKILYVLRKFPNFALLMFKLKGLAYAVFRVK